MSKLTIVICLRLLPDLNFLNLPAALAVNNFLELPITIEHSQKLYRLPLHHNDPFVRVAYRR
jgi:PIN domain nuclease of toxin-antitoxin system